MYPFRAKLGGKLVCLDEEAGNGGDRKKKEPRLIFLLLLLCFAKPENVIRAGCVCDMGGSGRIWEDLSLGPGQLWQVVISCPISCTFIPSPSLFPLPPFFFFLLTLFSEMDQVRIMTVVHDWKGTQEDHVDLLMAGENVLLQAEIDSEWCRVKPFRLAKAGLAPVSCLVKSEHFSGMPYCHVISERCHGDLGWVFF